MAILTLAALTEPLPGQQACGNDLDLAGDADFMGFMASAEGLLPATFYSAIDNRPFDRTSVDFATQYETIAALAKRTQDVRLLVLLAKFRILDRDPAGFVTALEAIAALLDDAWEGVHPCADDGDFTLRMAIIQSLDDMVPVILPLHYVPLFEHRHAGPISYRSHLLAEGEATPRGDEDKLDLALIKRAFAEAELAPLIERRDQFKRIGAALGRIKAAFVEHVGAADAVAFPKLQPLVEKIHALLDAQVIQRDPSAGEEKSTPEEGQGEAREPGQEVSGEITNFSDARAALGAIAAYYERREPSNPALLLVRQAEQLVGKSFLDALRVLVPGYVEDVKVQIGRTQVFDLPVERLSEFAFVESGAEETEVAEFSVTNRENALQLLAKVSAFYHATEPSSPVPYLIERARNFAGRDFLGLLREMLPRDTLRTVEGK
jgi:type VI secretion system protein ImpA